MVGGAAGVSFDGGLGDVGTRWNFLLVRSYLIISVPPGLVEKRLVPAGLCHMRLLVVGEMRPVVGSVLEVLGLDLLSIDLMGEGDGVLRVVGVVIVEESCIGLFNLAVSKFSRVLDVGFMGVVGSLYLYFFWSGVHWFGSSSFSGLLTPANNAGNAAGSCVS